MASLGSFIAIALVVFVGTASAQMSTKATIVVGTDLYFTDPNNNVRNRAAALDYCKDNGGVLAKIADLAAFNAIRIAVPNAGYWIEGIDNGAYSETGTMTPVDLSFLGPDNLRFTPRACLALIKGSTSITTYVQNQNCDAGNHVICSIPLPPAPTP